MCPQQSFERGLLRALRKLLRLAQPWCCCGLLLLQLA
jgi:hypothetical protein